jgi:hypothetical protein
MTALCPNGHASDEPDYCSVCGAPMGATTPDPAAPTPAPAAGPTCPSCGAPRADVNARFCEVCRYDFESGTPGPPPVAPAAPDPPAAAPDPPASPGPPDPPAPVPTAADPPAPDPPAPPAPTGPADWDVTVVVDTSLDTEPDPDSPAPTGVGERIFPVDLAEMLIGRRDEKHDIRPEVPIQDPAVSRRHAKLLRLPGGGLAVLDLASANGTAVNGTETPAGERHELADGDEITLGRWTRITVRRRP